jgi:uncharacterized protein with von Willebrand factor type A (vWA) domain
MQINIIDLVPTELRRRVITLRSSHLSQRALGVSQMYQDLMYQQSQDWAWPTGHMKELIEKWLIETDFRQYAYQQHDLVIQFLDHVLAYIQDEDLNINECDQQKAQTTSDIQDKQQELSQWQKKKKELDKGKFMGAFGFGQNKSKPSQEPQISSDLSHLDDFINAEQSQSKQSKDQSKTKTTDSKTPKENQEFCLNKIKDITAEIAQLQVQIVKIDDRLKQIYKNILDNVLSKWDQQVKAWKKIKGLLDLLQDFIGIPSYDLSRSVLKANHAWYDINRLQQLISQCQEIHKIAESLGRLKETEDSESSFEEIFEPIKRNQSLLKEIPDSVPESFDGVELSSSISRMLPSESILLLRPKLKSLFHLKRIEEKLNTYRPEGTRLEQDFFEEEKAEKNKKKKPKKGPIILCLDTSGSMSGTPENVAKAIALVLLKIAYVEKRPYMMYNFSGPGDFVKSEYQPNGIQNMIIDVLHLIGQSFGGGTDVEGPLKKAIEDVSTKDWQKADILVVSDGGFDVSEALIKKIKDCHQKFGTRVHGLLIGGSDEVMSKICNPLHHFNHW